MRVELSRKQLRWVQDEILDDLEANAELDELPFIDGNDLVIPDEEALITIRDYIIEIALEGDWPLKGRERSMVQNILDWIDVISGREDKIADGEVVEFEEWRGGRNRRYTQKGPWPKRW